MSAWSTGTSQSFCREAAGAYQLERSPCSPSRPRVEPSVATGSACVCRECLETGRGRERVEFRAARARM